MMYRIFIFLVFYWATIAAVTVAHKALTRKERRESSPFYDADSTFDLNADQYTLV